MTGSLSVPDGDAARLRACAADLLSGQLALQDAGGQQRRGAPPYDRVEQDGTLAGGEVGGGLGKRRRRGRRGPVPPRAQPES